MAMLSMDVCTIRTSADTRDMSYTFRNTYHQKVTLNASLLYWCRPAMCSGRVGCHTLVLFVFEWSQRVAAPKLSRSLTTVAPLMFVFSSFSLPLFRFEGSVCDIRYLRTECDLTRYVVSKTDVTTSSCESFPFNGLFDV